MEARGACRRSSNHRAGSSEHGRRGGSSNHRAGSSARGRRGGSRFVGAKCHMTSFFASKISILRHDLQKGGAPKSLRKFIKVHENSLQCRCSVPLAAQMGRRRCLVDPACLAGLLLRPRVVSHAQRVEGTSYPQRSGCEVRAPPPIGGGRPPVDPADWLAQCRGLQRGCARPSRDSTPCRPQRGTVGYAVIFTAKGIHPDRSGGPARSSLLAGTVPSSSARRARSRLGARFRGRGRAGLALPWSWGWAWSSGAGAGSSDQYSGGYRGVLG